MKSITLTVQANGSGGYRLGINSADSKKIFKYRRRLVHIIVNGYKIDCNTACGPSDKKGNWILENPKTKKPFRKKGYDLNHKKIDKWIKENNYQNDKKYNKNYTKGHPTKLKFEYGSKKRVIYLNFIGKEEIVIPKNK